MLKTPVQYLVIEAEYALQRIDNFLITYLKCVPKTHIYRILRKGEVRVNKKRIQPSYRLQAGDQLRLPPLELAEQSEPTVPGQRSVAMLSNRTLYEDDKLLIINKPSGIPVHGGTGTSMGVVETLRVMHPHLAHLELAHRLDVSTSGCLILAKKRSALRELHELFRAGGLNKIYLTLTKGQWDSCDLRVDAPLRKNHLSSGERIVKVDPEGKESLSVFRPVQSFAIASLMEVTLHTGRTHQIRVHARYRGHPVAGDDKYGDKEFDKKMREYGLKRLFLHAHSLEFTLPSTKKTIKVMAPLDLELQACLNRMLDNKH